MFEKESKHGWWSRSIKSEEFLARRRDYMTEEDEAVKCEDLRVGNLNGRFQMHLESSYVVRTAYV
ncbi:hypothetical protein LR48_Vigan50s002900 [Vigna angularis]|uniref:Uncharacterized protein n=1 Tax=Phaseolus angularis TaxID=3914 RepID=A0A0L9T4T3_PHAAN|nr:hypothetical protein LR48_Vigan50s002900 [Vigna angularis]